MAKNLTTHLPSRRRLPETRFGITRKIVACGFKHYITVNFFPDNTPGEVFVIIAKEGSTIAGFIDALMVTISISLQYNVPWEVLYDKYLNQIFEPRDDINSSLVHAIATELDQIIKLWQETHIKELT